MAKTPIEWDDHVIAAMEVRDLAAAKRIDLGEFTRLVIFEQYGTVLDSSEHRLDHAVV